MKLTQFVSSFALAMLYVCTCGVEADAVCTGLNAAPPCAVRAARDLLFLVDSSDSVDPSTFYTNVLDYTQGLFCAFNQTDTIRVGLVVYGKTVEEKIPFKQYTAEDWFAAVDALRAQQDACCACCSPLATALNLAQTILKRDPSPQAFVSVFIVSDGSVWQNKDGEQFSFPKLSPAAYKYKVVPSQAQKLKALQARLLFIGFPNKNGEPAQINYFQGIPDTDNHPHGKKNPRIQCVLRGGRKTCAMMKLPPFPIVSSPIDKNVLASSNGNTQQLLDLTISSLCPVPLG